MSHDKLKENQWYCIYKEGKDKWNQWASPVMTQAQKLEYNISGGLNYNEIRRQLGKKYTEAGITAQVPDPRELINFSDTVWAGTADFDDFFIPANISFCNTIFQSGANFRRTHFNGELNMAGKTVFKSGAYFTNTKFNDFSISAHFKQEANFNNAVFSGMADFNQSIFYSTTTFKSALFKKAANFSETAFKTLPNLLGSQIDGDISLNYEQIMDIQSHEVTHWAKLKLETSRMHLHEEEVSLFAKELEARAQKARRAKKLLINIYKEISDYGRSIARPTILLFWFILAFAALYNGILLGQSGVTIKAYLMSVQSAFPLIPVDKQLLAKIQLYEKLSGLEIISLQTLRGLQTLLSTILLFLIGLGIRNRLRIK